jgi:CheY-like chemotaxis protein
MTLINSQNILTDLKHQGVNIPIVALSEDIQDKNKQIYFELGVVDFISKPPTREVYLQAITHAITIKQEIKCPV